MITSSDSEYYSTKQIKQRKAKLEPVFAELASWIAAKWQVSVLNIVYDPANELHEPRLQVIVEQREDEIIFRDGLNFDAFKLHEIVLRFSEIVTRQKNTDFELKNLFVVFSAFAPLAIEELVGTLTKKRIDHLMAQIANPELWTINQCLGNVTFFFYTEDQMHKYDRQGFKKIYSQFCLALLKPYDEFGYLNENVFSVNFDSKKNFDKKYSGNWFNYYR